MTGGPGWGYVGHDSRANFIDNIAYGVLGAAFVAETGNETGTWEGNIAINTYGADFNSLLLGPKGVYRYENDDFHLTILLEKRGAWKNHDFGHFGNGYWFQGKQIGRREQRLGQLGHAGLLLHVPRPRPDQRAARSDQGAGGHSTARTVRTRSRRACASSTTTSPSPTAADWR